MFSEIFIFIEEFIIAYGPLGIFLGSILEEIIAPIPSTAVIMGSSFFIMGNSQISFQAFEKLFLHIAIPAASGVTIGSLFIYGIVYEVGKPFVDRWGKYLGLSWEEIEKTEEKYSEKNLIEFSLFTARALPIIPSVVISAFCGFIKFDIKKYLIITFSGTLIRAFILGFIAWQFGSLYKQIESQIAISEEIVLIGLLIAVICFVIYKKYRNR
ncbi:MAG: VTT domain-containing protein [Methanobacterium sp.]|jgi:membrane protein DedA with SNARE-associated domain